MLRVEVLDITENCDDVIFLAARQCYNEGSIIDLFDDEQITWSEADRTKLIRHCIDSGHGTVIEHAKVTFAIDGISRALSHQLVRHRIASYSQQSQRYAGLGKGGFVIPMSIRNDQEALNMFRKSLEDVEETFKALVKAFNIPAEDARYILPNATVTRVVVTMNFRALLHFFEERTCKCAQWEIRAMAKAMLEAVKGKSVCFDHAGPKCERLGYCPESSNRCCGRKPLKRVFFSALDELSKVQLELENQAKLMYDSVDDGK